MLATQLKPNMSSQLSLIAAVWSGCSQPDDVLQMGRELTSSWDGTVSAHLLSVARGSQSLWALAWLLICFVSTCQFLLSSFSLAHFLPLLSFIYPPTCCCHRRLSPLGSEKECSSAGGDLTQRASWLGLRGAIYKWLLINPRPTLMLSHIFSFPSHAHLHELGLLGNRHAYRCEWKSVKILRFCQQPARFIY